MKVLSSVRIERKIKSDVQKDGPSSIACVLPRDVYDIFQPLSFIGILVRLGQSVA